MTVLVLFMMQFRVDVVLLQDSSSVCCYKKGEEKFIFDDEHSLVI
jgi:hypothetical protein